MEQAAVIAFLSAPSAYADRPEGVERIDTHGAIVFLAGSDVFKIKRAVRYAYMDLSTLALRRRNCERELEINRPLAPEIYLGVVAITREADGRLRIGGDGEPVEWAVHMRRFPESDLLARMAERGEISLGLIDELAAAVLAMHRAAPAAGHQVVLRTLAATAQGVLEGLAGGRLPFAAGDLAELGAGLGRALQRSRHVLAFRRERGFVRRCHGDLHLGNVVVIAGRPVPFDALEFDEALATTDTLYDLAFLVMDLDQRGLRPAANHLLNRYLQLSGDALDVLGLRALPLMLSLRAAIRSLVGAQRAAAAAADDPAARAAVEGTFAYARSVLVPVRPTLVAIGGFSGTGKSTLARMLAPAIGRAPGAIHLRSDIERKRLAGVPDTARLPPASYTAAESARVYACLLRKAGVALRAGYSVVVDAVFSTDAERVAGAGLARRVGARFAGLWLEADAETLRRRVGARRGDASDATVDVVDLQLARGAGASSWHRVDATGTAEATAAQACKILGLP